MNQTTVEGRRATDCAIDGAYALAVVYTIGYLAMVALLMFFNIPQNNREILLSLIGIMSAAQLAIVKHYYDGSKGAEQAQMANIVRSSKADAVVQEIAKTAPLTAAAAVAAATGAPVPTPAPAPTGDIATEVLNVTSDVTNVTPAAPTTDGDSKP